MSTETAILKNRKGVEVEVQAEVKRYTASSRSLVAGGLVLTTTTLGLGTIVIPGLHFVGPWLIPLLGMAVAWYLYNRVMVVGNVTGDCPDCDKPMTITEGGSVGNDPMWLRCPHCHTPLEFLPGAETPAA